MPVICYSPNAPEDFPAKAGPPRVTILFVEDEIMLRMPVADYLRECGYRVVEASRADEAQAILRSGEAVDVLLSDINMPGEMDGLDLARWVNRAFPSTRCILVSGAAKIDKAARDLCLNAALVKPYSLFAVEAEIKRVVASRHYH